MKLLRRTAPEPVVTVPTPRISDDVLSAVLTKDRRHAQQPYSGPDRRQPQA